MLPLPATMFSYSLTHFILILHTPLNYHRNTKYLLRSKRLGTSNCPSSLESCLLFQRQGSIECINPLVLKKWMQGEPQERREHNHQRHIHHQHHPKHESSWSPKIMSSLGTFSIQQFQAWRHGLDDSERRYLKFPESSRYLSKEMKWEGRMDDRESSWINIGIGTYL